ncbi:hypothetical protein KR059_006801 [Drosophila kikkawai]|nr:hypothetical protein KR059_006801 [Drosophila kikkawai]
MPLIEVGSSAAPGGVYPENGTKQLHTKTTQSLAKPEASFNSEPAAAAGSLLSLFNLQGQKWQQVFDLDKVIKQLRTAEKTYLRGGKNSSTAAAAAAAAAAGGGDQQQQAKVQVQRLQSADMAYYDLVPKLASRDIVLCGSCSGSYTKAGFQHHIALQHPSVWEATSSKVVSPNGNHAIAGAGGGDARLTATESHNSQEAGGVGGSLVAHSPTDTLLSASTLSSCSNGSSSSASLQHPAGTSSSSSSSSRHKSSSSKSSSSSSSKGSSGGGGGTSSSSGGSRSRSKSSKNRHHSSPALAAAEHKESKGSKKNGGSSSSAIAAPPIVAAVKEEPPAAATAPAITVFSSSSNSSCSLPPTPAAVAASDLGTGLGVNSYSPAEAEKLPELQPRKKLKGSSDHRTKAEREKNKEKALVNPYEQQQQVLSELDQAVSSITAGALVEQQQQQQVVAPNEDDELPLPNTSDENSISQTLDEMLDSKLINEILNNFDESALDTSQQQQQQQQQPSQNGNPLPHPAQATKRLRFEDATDTGEGYASYPQVYAAAAEEEDQQQELTTIDAMQLQQLIYQQQQMLDQQQQQEQQQQQDQKLLQDQEQQRQFSVYNVQSLTDEALAHPQQQQQQLEEHMILPSIIYEISDSNPVSMLEQQKVIAEFLTQAGYENVDVNVLAQTAGTGMESATSHNHNHLADELSDFEFSKLETVSDTVKTVKLEATTGGPTSQPPQVNHHHHHHHSSLEDSFFNVMLYSGSPRPLALNTFGMVKLPQGLGVTFRKNLLTTRKANNSLLSLTGGSHLGVVGQLARPPPPPASNTSSPLSNGLPAKNSSAGRTIYAQRSSVIAQDRLRCNKRALLAPVGKIGEGGPMTPKRLNELLMGKQVKKEAAERESEEADQQEEDSSKQLTHSFYEKRRRLLRPLQSHHNASQSYSHSHSPQQQQQHLLKKQLLRTLSDGSSNMNISHTPSANSSSSNPPWKGNSSSSNPGGSNSSSTPTSSDLMRVFVGS